MVFKPKLSFNLIQRSMGLFIEIIIFQIAYYPTFCVMIKNITSTDKSSRILIIYSVNPVLFCSFLLHNCLLNLNLIM